MCCVLCSFYWSTHIVSRSDIADFLQLTAGLLAERKIIKENNNNNNINNNNNNNDNEMN